MSTTGGHAEVEHRATGLRGIVQARGGIERRVEAEARLDTAQCADRALGQPAGHVGIDGKETRPQGFHQEDVALGRQRGEGDRFAGIRGHGFFAEHRHAGVQRSADRSGMEGVRGGDVDRAHARVGEQGR
jgi:hypothetical protein